jgi:hypothetical protein
MAMAGHPRRMKMVLVAWLTSSHLDACELEFE